MNVSAALAWLQAQVTALFATVRNIVANRPEPARQVIIDVLVTLAVAVALLKIAKTVSK